MVSSVHARVDRYVLSVERMPSVECRPSMAGQTWPNAAEASSWPLLHDVPLTFRTSALSREVHGVDIAEHSPHPFIDSLAERYEQKRGLHYVSISMRAVSISSLPLMSIPWLDAILQVEAAIARLGDP